jgi:hypothetical protein
VNAEREAEVAAERKCGKLESATGTPTTRLRRMDERNRRKNKSRDGETAHQQYARGVHGKAKQKLNRTPSRKSSRKHRNQYI